MQSKLVNSIREAIELSGLKSGMSVSFHHHLRNGDHTLNMVMDEIAALGIRELTLNASSIFDIHAPLEDHIRNHVVRKINTNYMSAGLGHRISEGLMDEPVDFRTHGGRPRDIALGVTPIDVAFIAAPAADAAGNCSGMYGPSACGSLGYAFPDAMYAKKVIVITDNLQPYPMIGWSIPEIYVDYVVQVPAIGDPKGIVSGTTKITRDPVGLVMARSAVEVIRRNAQNVLKDTLDERAQIVKQDYRSVISALQGRRFDLVFLDPPYRLLEAYPDAIERLQKADALSEDAVIVCERRFNAVISVPEGFEIFDTRAYGETSIDFVRRRTGERVEV